MDVYITPPEKYMIEDINVDDLMDNIISTCGNLMVGMARDIGNSPCLDHQSKNGFDRYLKDLQYSDVRTLKAIIKFNDYIPDLEFDNGQSSGGNRRNVTIFSKPYQISARTRTIFVA